jgi:poly [ADP-ribose] polymerase 2/3/4
MATLIKERRFIKSDVAKNNNKFWYIELYDNCEVITRNGRVGDSAQVHPKSFSSMSAAETFFDGKIREKTGDRKGYTELKVVIGANTEVKQVASGSLADIALKQISSNNTNTQKLIRYLSQKNVHNIVSATTIEYDESKGTFSTPCGIITQEGIDTARDLLDDISPYITQNKWHDSDFVKKIQQYIQLIPRKTARKLVVEELIPTLEAINKENQILDALSASLQQVISTPITDATEKDQPKVFSVSVDVIDDKKILDHIKKFFNQTRNQMHTSANLNIKTVYAVKIDHMALAYETKGKKLGNVMELWHGTRVENVLSILKGGLVIPSSGAKHVTGRMFGDGLYFSDQSTKSLNYAQGYWGHGSHDNNCFMFLADVAMGKAYTPSSSDSSLHNRIAKMGYDSCYAKANQSGVRNNEMIVYNLHQANLTYLIEFSDK